MCRLIIHNMNTGSGWLKSLKMLQNRLFVTSNVLSRSRASQVILSRFLSVNPHFHTRYGVSDYGLHRGTRLRLASMICGVQSISPTWPVRSLSTSGIRGVASKRSDNRLPQDSLIYTGPQSNMVKLVKLFSVSTSGLSLMIMQILLMSSESGAMKVLGGSMASVLFLTPIALHWISKSYVTQMYFNQATDTFTSYTISFFLASIRQDFKPSDVEVPATRNLMTSVVVKGKPLLFDPRAFVHPNHYSHLMGYDKLPDDFSAEDLKKAMADYLEDDDDQHKDSKTESK